MSVINVVVERIAAKTPVFFKKLRNLATTLGAAAGAVWGANSTMALALPDPMLTVCKYAIAVSVAVAAVSQLTKEDPTK